MKPLPDLLKSVADLGLGMVAVGREKVESKLREWAESGKLSVDESKSVIDALRARGEQDRLELQRMIQEQVQNALSKAGFASTPTTTVDIEDAVVQEMGLTMDAEDIVSGAAASTETSTGTSVVSAHPLGEARSEEHVSSAVLDALRQLEKRVTALEQKVAELSTH